MIRGGKNMNSTRNIKLCRRFYQKFLSYVIYKYNQEKRKSINIDFSAEKSCYTSTIKEEDLILYEPDNLQETLESFWLAENSPELAAFAEDLIDLNQNLDDYPSSDLDIPPFIYVMY